MPSFVKVQDVTRYTFKAQGNLAGSERIFSAREIRELGEKHNEVVAAIQEMQAFLKTAYP